MKFVWKNYLLLLGFLLLSLALLTAVISIWQAGRALEALREGERFFARTAATQVETGYHEQVWPFEMLTDMSRHPEFVYWRVVDGDGKIVLSCPPAVEGGAPATVRVPEGLLDRPLLTPGEGLDGETWIVPMRMRTGARPWTFWLGFTRRLVTERVHGFVLTSVLFGCVVAVVLIPFSLIASRRLVQPVENLSGAAARMAAGDLDVSLPRAGRDEIGRLVRSFQAMAASVRARDAEIRAQMVALRKARDELEDRVRERTAELTQANGELQKEIRQRQRTEEALRESETRYRIVVEQTGQLVYDYDIPSGRIQWSGAVRQVTGWSPEEFAAFDIWAWQNALHPEDRDRVVAILQDTMNRASPFVAEYRFRRADGSYMHIEDCGTYIEAEHGAVVRMLGVMKDITQRKLAEAQIQQDISVRTVVNDVLRLQLSDVSLAKLLEQFLDKVLAVPWLALEPRGAVFLTDPATDELVMVAQRQLAPEVQAACARVALGQCICGKAAQARQAIFCDHLDERHEVRYADMRDHGHHCLPLLSSSRKVLGVLNLYAQPGCCATEKDKEFLAALGNVLASLIERKLAEEALRDSENHLRTMMDNVQMGILMIDAETHVIVDVNTLAVEMIGLPKDQIAGAVCHQHVCPAEVGKCPITDLGQTVDRSERVLVCGDGHRCPILKTVMMLTVRGRQYLLESFVDITERKRLEDELQRSHDLLEVRVVERTAELVKANEQVRQAQMDLVQSEKMSMLGQLVAGVAHEINTPTGAILNVMADARDHLRAMWEAAESQSQLPEDVRSWLGQACRRVLSGTEDHSEAGSRAVRRQIEQELTAKGCDGARRLAGIILGCFGEGWRDEARLLEHLSMEPVREVLEHMVALRTSTDISLASARKTARIVQALRYYSHAGQDELSDMNVNESIDNTLVILQNRIKRIAEVQVTFDPALPPVRCGPDISQVWTNILNNACDALEEGRREGAGHLEVVTRREDDWIVVRISDDGPAIPEDVIHRIFDPFFTTKTVGKGTGLGLGICQGILRRCGGSIEAINEPGRVTFEVRLLVAAVAHRDGVPALAGADRSPAGVTNA